MLFSGRIDVCQFPGRRSRFVFVFILWFWLFITAASDLFRRHDIGPRQGPWVILLIVLPYIGIFAYILTQGSGMAERNQQARQARDEAASDGWLQHCRRAGRSSNG